MRIDRPGPAPRAKIAEEPDSEFGIIIVSSDRKPSLVRLLDRLAETPAWMDSTVVIDNGSSDGTAEMVATRYREATLIRLPENRGVPYARNLGALVARHRMLLFLDDDGLPDIPRVPMLAQRMREDPTLAVIGLNVVECAVGKALCEETGQRRCTGPVAGPALIPARTFCGGAALIRRDAFIQAGLYPAHFFYSLEEDDLAFRLRRCGYWIAFCPSVRFFHRRVADRGASGGRARLYYRNQLRVHWRNLPMGAAVVETLASIAGGFVRTLGTPCFRGFASGIAEALAEWTDVVRNERQPLTRAQYKQCRTTFRRSLNPVRRWWHLLCDITGRKRLDWLDGSEGGG